MGGERHPLLPTATGQRGQTWLCFLILSPPRAVSEGEGCVCECVHVCRCEYCVSMNACVCLYAGMHILTRACFLRNDHKLLQQLEVNE